MRLSTPTHLLLMSTICFSLLTFSPTSVFSQKNASSQGTNVNFETAKDQGLLYYQKGRLPLAREQFDLAYSTPEGKKDFIIVFYRGKLAEQQLKLEVAFEMAELAVKLAKPNSKDMQIAQELFEQLKGQFSYVAINAAKEETNKRGRVYLEVKRRILNKKKRSQFQSIRTRFRSTDVELPTKIYLPYGKYTANNVPFHIKQNSSEPPSVDIFLHIITKNLPKESKVLLYTGLGVAGAALIGVGAYLFLTPDPIQKESTSFGFKQMTGE